jgi:hypothetical protein
VRDGRRNESTQYKAIIWFHMKRDEPMYYYYCYYMGLLKMLFTAQAQK